MYQLIVYNSYMYKQEKISLIIPAKNEKSNLLRLLPTIPQVIDEVLVVDGKSIDGTREFLENYPKVKYLLQQNSGKGAAIQLGVNNAKFEYIICMDADGSMDVNEIPLLLSLLIDKKNDLVKGSRYIYGGGSSDLTAIRSLGNKVLLRIVNLFFKCSWTDLAYGYFGINKSAYQELGISDYRNYGNGFEIETVIFCRASRFRLRIKEFPSLESKRWTGKSNLMAIPVGLRILFAIFFERFRNSNHFNPR